jgi:hypothetical protein
LAELVLTQTRDFEKRSASRGRRLLAASGVSLAALVLPNVAFAHGGKSAPVATNFEARIGKLTPADSAVEAKVVDGDRALWLHVRGNATVLIPGALGEPLLRFDRAGVFVNLHSITAQSDRIEQLYLRPSLNPHARPLWRRLTGGHSYLWHEHRLHALEGLARGHQTTAVLGRWSVPLLIDGREHALEGVLVYRPPGRLWPWLLLPAALALVTASALARTSSLARRVAIAAALVAMLLVWVVRIGRELYGRPIVGVTGYVAIGLTSLVGVGLLYGLLHRDAGVRLFTALLVAVGCLYQGWTMLGVLTHAVALTVLPTLAARAAVVAILGLGVGVFAITLRELFGESADEDARAAGAEQAGPRPIGKPGPA